MRLTERFTITHKDGVEPLQECHTVDEVKTLARGGSEITDNEIYTVGIAANGTVQSTLRWAISLERLTNAAGGYSPAMLERWP